MKTYWDYTQKERSEFTDEQVKALLDVEMMKEGVLKPVAPTLTPIETPDSIGTRKMYYGVKGKGKYGSGEGLGICFETAEQAAKFIELRPLKQDYDYEIGSDYPYAKPVSAMAIETAELFSWETINGAHANLKKNKAARDENERIQTEYNKAIETANKVTTKVWEDWHCARAMAVNMRQVVDTYKEYVKLAGDENLALTFLGKIFHEDKIEDARSWFPGELPKWEPIKI